MTALSLRERTGRGQDRLLRLLGSTPVQRAPLVSSLLKRDATEATAYWLQLVVSLGIATLGLATGSTAVVIGAMLVAPLMGPILGLAMGLAAGSPFLTLRSVGRILLSVLVVITGAAIITLALPFRDLNGELLARTTPTVLDLFTAVCCALAGVFATLRPVQDTATTAAGTSISISLVPPLCVTGYTLGIGRADLAAGAFLLFTTNMVAIVVVGTAAFLLTGFARVETVDIEHAELERDVDEATVSRAIVQRLAFAFESRWGWATRLLIPLMLLAAVYVPLRQALNEVAWQVAARNTVRDEISAAAPSALTRSIHTERGRIEVSLAIVGTSEDATNLTTRLTKRLERLASQPVVRVVALANAEALPERLPLPVAVPTTPPPPFATRLAGLEQELTLALHKLWPASQALPSRLALSRGDDGIHVDSYRQGMALASESREIIEQQLSASLGTSVHVHDHVLPASVELHTTKPLALEASLAVLAEAKALNAWICETAAETARLRPQPKLSIQFQARLQAMLAGYARYKPASTNTDQLGVSL